MSKTFTLLTEIADNECRLLPKAGYIKKSTFKDVKDSVIHILTIGNGRLAFAVLIERGLDIGEWFVGDEKASWNRSAEHLLHPEHVDLSKNGGTGWLAGFYPAVASIGPELFGTPGEGYTLHGSGSYSPADPGSVSISVGRDAILVEGLVNIRDRNNNLLFEKKISYTTWFHSPCVLREERTKNVSEAARVVDDGLHIQLAGSYIDQGGYYILPVKAYEMLLRDSAPPEADPFAICPLADGKQPLRCYQYVPGPVSGLEEIGELEPALASLESETGLSSEMIINKAEDTAAYLIRPLDCFPRSLIAKEIGETAMFSLEPCRTRPNRMSQKITDGEAVFVQPGASTKTRCVMGVTKDQKTITRMKELILAAAGK